MSQSSNNQALAKVKNILSNPPINKTVLIQLSTDHIWICNAMLIKILQDNNYSGVYVTLTKNYKEISEDFKQSGIDNSSIVFIDGISKLYGIPEAKDENVKYINGPLALKDLTSKIQLSLESIASTKKYIFVGSLTSLMLYNSSSKIVEFLEEINKFVKSDTVIFATQFCDNNFTKKIENSFDQKTLDIDLRECK